MYTSYQLTPTSRKQLLDKFPPKHEKVVAHHITHEFGVHKDTPLPTIADIKVVGYHNDPEGLEVLVVSVNGDVTRPDGNVYHITWSLNPEKFKPMHSNKLARGRNHRLIMPMEVRTSPSISQ